MRLPCPIACEPGPIDTGLRIASQAWERHGPARRVRVRQPLRVPVHRTLTPQQRKIVRLLSLGCTVVEAGRILGIAASTVDNHKFRAMRLLGIRKIAILTRYAMLNGISNLEDCLTLEELERMRGSRR